MVWSCKEQSNTQERSSPSARSSHQCFSHNPHSEACTLPDSILSHILSFLPTEEVLKTRLLSKRWKPVWRAVSCIHFDHPYEISDYKTFFYHRTVDPQRNIIDTASFFPSFFERETCSKFLESVNSFRRLSYDIEEPLQELSFACCSFCDSACIKAQIELIMKTRYDTLKHLDLNLNGNIVVPSKLLTCNTLTVLKLTYLKVEDDISFHHLNSLKILHLNYVNFLNGLDLSQFPSSLEELELSSVSNVRENLNRLPQVKKVTLDNNDLVPFKSIENVEILIIERICYAQICYEDPVFQFENLLHLTLKVLPRHKWFELLKMLDGCPRLQILSLNLSLLSPLDKAPGQWNETNQSSESHLIEFWSVPHCFSHLKSCKIQNYRDFPDELRFATHILQNATSLQMMKICFGAVGPRETADIRNELSSFPRSSEDCQILFE